MVVYRLRRAYPNISALIRRLLEKEASKLAPNGGTAKNGAFLVGRVEPRPGFEPGTPALPGQCSNQAELPGRPYARDKSAI